MEIGVGIGGGGGRGRGLVGSEIHGFRTVEDLDINGIRNEARSRWLQPNEILAILSNSSYFRINSKPVNLPQSGTMLLFDRKTLRNFRKDGHNWKKKKDGKTVKEAHEHLKVGGVERIHVYYAHGEDKPNFVRRCYWLLDKAMEHIVLVHYRETQEEGSPVTPKLSYSSSEISDLSSSQLVLEEISSEYDRASTNGQLGFADIGNARNNAMKLQELDTSGWDELLGSTDPNNSIVAAGGTLNFQQFSHDTSNFTNNMGYTTNLQAETFTLGNSGELSSSCMNNFFPQAMSGQVVVNEQNTISRPQTGASGITMENSLGDGLQAQDSFGRWMNDIMIDASEQLEVPSSESLVLTDHNSSSSPSMTDPQTFIPQSIFSITDISPTWGFATEETKILAIGFFHEEYQHLANSPLYCICGEESVPVEAVQAGVFRCLIPAHGLPGLVNFYLSIDRSSPVSQVLSFEFRSHVYKNVVSTEEDSNWEECQFQIRLAHLLFSTSKSLDIFSRGPSRITTKDATKFFLKTLTIDVSSWAYLIELIRNGKMLLTQAKESLLELTLKNKLNEWLLERLMYRDSIIERDEQGQGVLHLCAILGYVWAVYPFTLSGLSLDFRDKFGWTALHWAAYYGREQMVAALLSAGAKPNLVTDPTPENPGGCTPGDIAIVKGYEGLAAFLSEKALVQQFNDMKLAGHASGSLETATSQGPSANEEDNSLHDALAASRMAADAAARIQAAFREHSFKLRTKAVESSNPEMEARNIIAAMKIQQAFRNYEGRKKMAAAAHIQGSYRTWKLRTEFLNKRRHAIRIQAAFRGFQMRKQYRKILWSVGFLEKAILRWRLKRKGLRGLHVGPTEPITSQHQGNATEEDFFRASRQQAEERVERAVVRVQAMFRSKKAQEEYRRMKLTHIQAKINYDETVHYDSYLE